MSLTTDLLTSIGQGITLTRSGGPQVNPGEVVHFNLNTPDLTNVQVPVIGSGDFAVTWLLKSVRFKDALPAPLVAGTSLADSLATYLSATNILGGTPIAGVDVPVPGPSLKGAIPPTTVIGIGISTIAGNVAPPNTIATPTPVAASPATLPNVPPLTPNAPDANDVLSGVPGLLGQIGGSIPVLMSAPVTLSVKWKVQRNGVDLIAGTDFIAPSGLDGPAIDLILAPVFKELGQEGTSTVTVSATVTLHAATESVDVSPPALTLTVPDVGIPRVVAMFRHANFAPQDGGDSGFAFVMVPGNYAFRAFNQLSPVLTNLQTTLSTLNSFVHIASFLTGLSDLLDAVPTQPALQFRAADSVSDLEDIVFESHFFGDYDADEEISSVVFLGIPQSRFQIFNNDSFDEGDGRITLFTSDDMWVALTSFSFNDQAGADNVKEPPGSVVDVKFFDEGYNDEAESVRFAGQGTDIP